MREFGKLIVAKGFKNLPKVQKIAQSGHTDHYHQGSVTHQTCATHVIKAFTNVLRRRALLDKLRSNKDTLSP